MKGNGTTHRARAHARRRWRAVAIDTEPRARPLTERAHSHTPITERRAERHAGRSRRRVVPSQARARAQREEPDGQARAREERGRRRGDNDTGAHARLAPRRRAPRRRAPRGERPREAHASSPPPTAPDGADVAPSPGRHARGGEPPRVRGAMAPARRIRERERASDARWRAARARGRDRARPPPRFRRERRRQSDARAPPGAPRESARARGVDAQERENREKETQARVGYRPRSRDVATSRTRRRDVVPTTP